MLTLSSRSKALLLTLGIFVLGLVCGATAERWVLLSSNGVKKIPFRGPHPVNHPPTERYLNRFKRHLDLNPDQEKKIKQILEKSRESTRGIRKKVHTEMEDIRKTTREKIKKILTLKQQKKYDETLKLRRERIPGPPRRPPPPY